MATLYWFESRREHNAFSWWNDGTLYVSRRLFLAIRIIVTNVKLVC